MFDLLLEKETFRDDLKIASVTHVFKGGNYFKFGNYRPTSVLVWFSKILEHIIYDCFYKYLLENKIYYPQQRGFQVAHLTGKAITYLTCRSNF